MSDNRVYVFCGLAMRTEGNEGSNKVTAATCFGTLVAPTQEDAQRQAKEHRAKRYPIENGWEYAEPEVRTLLVEDDHLLADGRVMIEYQVKE